MNYCNNVYSHYADGEQIEFKENVKNNSLGLLNLQTITHSNLSAPSQFLTLGSDKTTNELKVADFDHIVKDEMDEQHLQTEETIVLMKCTKDDSMIISSEVAVKEELDEVEKFTDVDHIVKHEMDFEAEDTIVSMNYYNDDPYYAEGGRIEFEENASTINIGKDITEKCYECNVCHKKCKTKQTLIGHLKRHMKMTTHTRERPLSCNRCDKAFYKPSTLQTHMRIHTGEKPYSCKKCDKAFSQNSILRTHMKVHTGERPYSCNICDKAFSAKASLQRHILIHAEEKPYSCNRCDKTFVGSIHLQQHMRIHTVEKPYSCNRCDKGFYEISHWQVHMRTHTGEKPYSCKICDKAFTQNSSLKQHMLIHTGEKLYTCNRCNMSYSQRCYLQIHMRIHTGEKPYSCKICDKAFNQSCNLKRHMIIHTR